MTDVRYGDETEVWFRNPHNYIRELVEVGANQIAFDRGTVHRLRIDVDRWSKLYFGEQPYRILLIGDQGTAELDQDHTLSNPIGVYPTWVYSTDTFGLLEELAANPVGENLEKYAPDGSELAADERPVAGQPHKVIIVNPPAGNTAFGRTFFALLTDLQSEYPDCTFHIHGLYGYRLAFGLNLKSVDIDPRTGASKGKVTLPTGREIAREKLAPYQQWVHVLGYGIPDLEVPRNRCMFNIMSAIWAGKYYKQNIKIKTRGKRLTLDAFMPGDDAPRMNRVLSRRGVVGPGDKFACDSCALQDMCKYYREGAVCSVPGAETEALARFFKTRDSETIIGGLSELLSIQAERLEMGRNKELADDEIDPETSKLVNSMFDQGVKLAKLVDPSLRTGAKVNVGVFTAGGAVGGGGGVGAVGNNPQREIARVVAALEAQGIAREDITADMIASILDPSRTTKAIEGTAVVREG